MRGARLTGDSTTGLFGAKSATLCLAPAGTGSAKSWLSYSAQKLFQPARFSHLIQRGSSDKAS
jgi:hypothetical protein